MQADLLGKGRRSWAADNDAPIGADDGSIGVKIFIAVAVAENGAFWRERGVG
jgi:hypothetical protein